MSHSRRILVSLFLVALLPPSATLGFLLIRQSSIQEDIVRRSALDGIRQYKNYHRQLERTIQSSLEQIAGSAAVQMAIVQDRAGRRLDSKFENVGWNLDFVEMADADGRILLSMNRPGLIGESINHSMLVKRKKPGFSHTVEFSFAGRDASVTCWYPLASGHTLYGGLFLDSAMLAAIASVTGASISLQFAEDSLTFYQSFSQMEEGVLYHDEQGYKVLLSAEGDLPIQVMALFMSGENSSWFGNLLSVTALVALVSVLLALGLGIMVAGRIRREIDNLVAATSRVARGDLSTPVMAYEEGEFAILADSFTEMMQRLKESRRRLASAQQVAAWQIVGRHIAHEIKNPLTPISIAADDIRQAHRENLPNFTETVEQSTTMIKTEVRRMTLMLEEFVRFARMAPPSLKPVKLEQLLEELHDMYSGEIQSGRLQLRNDTKDQSYQLDPNQIKQLLINLIKNGLESGDDSHVQLHCYSTPEALHIDVADSGPGFSSDQLTSGAGPTSSTKPGGSGLGLLICQRIVVDHGGDMKLDNRPEGGAVVQVLLPHE